ncbi:MAG: 50S ribosomal protein L29 [bacterium]|nr:50S ribosomal protein L29 [bacterium]
MAKRTNMKTLSDTELTKTLADTRKDLREHRFAAAGSRPKDTNSLKKARKSIARVLTEQRVRHASPAGSVSPDSRPSK